MRTQLTLRCGIAIHALCLVTLTAQAQLNPTLQLKVSSETAPAGGTVQIKVWAATPSPIVSGRLFMYFDPTVFDTIAHATVFSAAGDVYGAVAIQNSAIDLLFTSPSGGIGRLPDLPVFAVTASIRADAAPGAKVSVTLDPSPQPWKDAQGNTYSVDVTRGTATVGGALSIQNVTPGGGILPTGTVVRVDGTGFATSTALAIEGVSVSQVQFVGPQQIDVTLGAPAELTGKRVRLSNLNGEQADHFSSFRAVPDANSQRLLAGGEIIFPLRTYTLAQTGNVVGRTIALQNPTSAPVDVIIDSFGFFMDNGPFKFTVAPRSVVVSTVPGPSKVNPSYFLVRASAPIQMLNIAGFGGTLSLATLDPAVPAPQLMPEQAVSFFWQIGTPVPMSRSLYLLSSGEPLPFTLSAATSSGGNWLSASPCPACVTYSSRELPITVTVNPSALAPGTYMGTVTATPTNPNSHPLVIPVPLTVSALAVSDFSLSFSAPDVTPLSATQTLMVTRNGPPAAVSAIATTASGGNWLSVTAQATTPATLTVAVNPSGLPAGQYTGNIRITGAGDTHNVAVYLVVGPVAQGFYQIVQFSAQGQSPPPPQDIFVPDVSVPAVTTTDGGNWLSAGASPYFSELRIQVNPAGLEPGTYQGIVTSGSPRMYQVSVTLMVFQNPAPSLNVTPARLVFASGGTAAATTQDIMVSSGGIPASIDIRTSGPVSASLVSTNVTPTAVRVSANAARAGVYTGSVTITADGQSVVVPVTLLVQAGVPVTPLVGSVVSGASQTRASVSPGEIITIHGDLIGPPLQYGVTLDSAGKVTTAADQTRVIFDGIPAPLLYASESQLNAIVPYEVAGHSVTMIEIEYYGMRSSALGIPVAPTAPAIFTVTGTGEGQAAVLNEDNSVNGPTNPAARGSVIQIYATGEGVTSPASITGSVTQSDIKKPVLPVMVTIGGLEATVTYAGSAPDSVSGLFQVNVTVPQGLAAGATVPVILTVGTARSPDGISIAVR